MKKWGFLLVFNFIFKILPISQDKVEDQIWKISGDDSMV